jgi:hypothetical protein
MYIFQLLGINKMLHVTDQRVLPPGALIANKLPTLQISDQTWRQLVPAGVTEDVQSEYTTYKHTTTLAFGCAAAPRDSFRRALPVMLVAVNEQYEHTAYRKGGGKPKEAVFTQSLYVSKDAGVSWTSEVIHVSNAPMQARVAVSPQGNWACIALFTLTTSLVMTCALSASRAAARNSHTTASPLPPITMVAIRNDGSGIAASEKEVWSFETSMLLTSMCDTTSRFLAVATNECRDVVACDAEKLHACKHGGKWLNQAASYSDVTMNEHWCLAVSSTDAAVYVNTAPGDFRTFRKVDGMDGGAARATAVSLAECNNHWLVAYNTGEIWHGSPLLEVASPPSVWMPVNNPGFTWSAVSMCNPVFSSVPVTYALADGTVYSNLSTFALRVYVSNQAYQLNVTPAL